MSNSTATPTTEAEESSVELNFLSNRLGSFLAVAPLGLWTLVHLWNNLSSLQGEHEWQTSVTTYQHPVGQAVASFVVLLPLRKGPPCALGRPSPRL